VAIHLGEIDSMTQAGAQAALTLADGERRTPA
jgi:hypothetical protein